MLGVYETFRKDENWDFQYAPIILGQVQLKTVHF